ncbi:hypothetical protein E2C01_055354 [Portunus trituberculatus]|uniref:Uncharacterized protein n=1 Tax=Portunus trituberculatus TaxID=210409 RepID=A0A5B7GXG9_PORTR|nr:hypothetical protein [Portunus trituberculatus]
MGLHRGSFCCSLLKGTVSGNLHMRILFKVASGVHATSFCHIMHSGLMVNGTLVFGNALSSLYKAVVTTTSGCEGPFHSHSRNSYVGFGRHVMMNIAECRRVECIRSLVAEYENNDKKTTRKSKQAFPRQITGMQCLGQGRWVRECCYETEEDAGASLSKVFLVEGQARVTSRPLGPLFSPVRPRPPYGALVQVPCRSPPAPWLLREGC